MAELSRTLITDGWHGCKQYATMSSDLAGRGGIATAAPVGSATPACGACETASGLLDVPCGAFVQAVPCVVTDASSLLSCGNRSLCNLCLQAM